MGVTDIFKESRRVSGGAAELKLYRGYGAGDDEGVERQVQGSKKLNDTIYRISYIASKIWRPSTCRDTLHNTSKHHESPQHGPTEGRALSGLYDGFLY